MFYKLFDNRMNTVEENNRYISELLNGSKEITLAERYDVANRLSKDEKLLRKARKQIAHMNSYTAQIAFADWSKNNVDHKLNAYNFSK